jgi:hypothetical protein
MILTGRGRLCGIGSSLKGAKKKDSGKYWPAVDLYAPTKPRSTTQKK